MQKREKFINLKIRYDDRPRHRVFWSDEIKQPENDENRGLGKNYVADPVPMASRDHVWPKRRILWSRVQNIFIENEYDINTKPSSPGNLKANSIVERIHQVLWDLVRTYNLQ